MVQAEASETQREEENHFATLIADSTPKHVDTVVLGQSALTLRYLVVISADW